MIKINVTKARQHFGEMIRRACGDNEHIMVEEDDLPVVVIMSIQDYEGMRQAAVLYNLERMNRALNRKARDQGLTPEALEEEVEETKDEIFEEFYG